MDIDPNERLAEIRARLGELKQEREALLAERDELRAALGHEPLPRGAARQSDELKR